MHRYLRILLLISPFILIHPSARADREFLGSRTSQFKDKTYRFDLTGAAVSKSPKWKAGDEFPPLSPRKAGDIALVQAKILRPEVTLWRTSAISLTPLNNRGNDWIYMVTIEDVSGPIAGVPWRLEIPVYLDGATVEPVVLRHVTR